MLGPLYKFRDREHLSELIDAVRQSGISVTEEYHANLPSDYWFREGLGKILGSLWPEECESIMYFGFGHAFNPLLWYSDGHLLKKVQTIFMAHGAERVDP